MANDHDHDHSIEQKYGGTVDSEVVGNYSTFLNAASQMLGRDLKVTTGGSSVNHLKWKNFVENARKYYGVTQEQVSKGSKKSKAGNTINQALINRAAKMMSRAAKQEYTRGAIDIGLRTNNLSNEETLSLGKLALKHGLRVGEEDHHLHLDSRQNTNPEAKRVFHENRVKKTDPRRAASLAREQALKQFLVDEEKANIEWNKAADAATIQDEKTRLMEPKEAARKQFLSNLANMKI